MKAKPKEVALPDLINNITEAVRREIREAAIFGEPMVQIPLPNDMDAEQELLSALLCGHVTVASLKPLNQGHFYGHFNQSAYVAIESLELAGEPVTVGAVFEIMQDIGLKGPLGEELTRIAECTPFLHPKRLRQGVDRVIEMAERRELIRKMQLVDRMLRSDETTLERAREYLEVRG